MKLIFFYYYLVRGGNRSQELCFRHDEFEVHFRHPSGDVEQASGFRSRGYGRNLSWTQTLGHHQYIDGVSSCGIACGDLGSRCRQKRRAAQGLSSGPRQHMGEMR